MERSPSFSAWVSRLLLTAWGGILLVFITAQQDSWVTQFLFYFMDEETSVDDYWVPTITLLVVVATIMFFFSLVGYYLCRVLDGQRGYSSWVISIVQIVPIVVLLWHLWFVVRVGLEMLAQPVNGIPS